MTLIADHEVVLADTGPFCRLAEAGEDHLDVAAKYLRRNLQVVKDVERELRRRAATSKHARLNRLKLIEVPAREAITITDGRLLADIEEIIEGRRRHKSSHPDEDRGEVATALVAASLGLPVLMDDGFGKSLAAARGVQVFTTQDLAVELAAMRQLGAKRAYGIYRLVYSGATEAGFRRAVDSLRARIRI